MSGEYDLEKGVTETGLSNVPSVTKPTWDGTVRGSPLYLEHVTYEVDYAVHSKSKNPFAKKVKAHKVVLDDVNANVQPADLVAIMGSSGAGKTTMLNIMACRIRPTSGELYLSGHPASGIKEIHRRIAYVMQDDVLMASLTVHECLKFAASLKLSTSTREARRERIAEVMLELGLTNVKDTIIGSANQRGISGGERKRTAIAIELLSRPAILFLDEPTSGLDSFTAESVIGTCKELASHGNTVVATIHQPNSDIFRMFNTVMFMAKGQLVYNGPGDHTVGYFRALGYDCPTYTNPADYFMKLLRIDMGKGAKGAENTVAQLRMDAGDARSDEFIRQWRAVEAQHLQPKGDPGTLAPPAALPRVLTQIKALFWRAFLNYARNKMLTRVRFGQALFFAVFVGCIFLRLGYNQADIQARMGAIFFTMMNQSMPAMMGIIHTFPAEKAVLSREHSNGMYALFPYYLSKFVSELPFQILIPFMFSCIFYWLVGLNPGVGQFFTFCGIMILMCTTACSLGIWVSAMAPSVGVALAIAPSIMLPIILFGGFFTPPAAMPVWCAWMRWISFFYYGFGAAVVNEFSDETFVCDTQPCYTSGNHVLTNYSLDNVSIAVYCLAVLGFAALFQILGFLSLCRAMRKVSSQ